MLYVYVVSTTGLGNFLTLSVVGGSVDKYRDYLHICRQSAYPTRYDYVV